MLRSLLLRDLTLHRRVLITATFLPFLFLGLVATASEQEANGMATLLWILGLLLLAVLPHSLHIREDRLGTLAGLFSLPVHRPEVVRLRFLEGALASLAFTTVYLTAWILLRHPPRQEALDLLSTSAPLWLLLIFLAYPMPFVLRWGAKGLLGSLGLLMAGFFLYVFLVMFGPRVLHVTWVATLDGWLRHAAFPAYLSLGLTWGFPLLLGTAFYGVSCWTLERVDA